MLTLILISLFSFVALAATNQFSKPARFCVFGLSVYTFSVFVWLFGSDAATVVLVLLAPLLVMRDVSNGNKTQQKPQTRQTPTRYPESKTASKKDTQVNPNRKNGLRISPAQAEEMMAELKPQQDPNDPSKTIYPVSREQVDRILGSAERTEDVSDMVGGLIGQEDTKPKSGEPLTMDAVRKMLPNSSLSSKPNKESPKELMSAASNLEEAAEIEKEQKKSQSFDGFVADHMQYVKCLNNPESCATEELKKLAEEYQVEKDGQNYDGKCTSCMKKQLLAKFIFRLKKQEEESE